MSESHAGAVRGYWQSMNARDWPGLARLLHPDVRYDVPQSREVVRGREAVVRFNAEYPGDWSLEPVRVVADERGAATWIDFRLDGESVPGLTFFTFQNGLIATVTDFWPEPFERPAGREHLSLVEPP